MRSRRLLAALSLLAVVAFGLPALLHPSRHSVRERGRGEEMGPYPSDWFGIQRAFPGTAINQAAWLAAVEQAVFDRASQDLSTNAAGDWTQAGPYNIGGRVTALAVANGGSTVYLGAANGGVFKSTNAGVNWSPIFDLAEPVFSIGALALEPGTSNVLYVGTGEANASVDSYDGKGVWRTPDGGLTWQSLGLQSTARIGRIAVDPSNTNRILVAAMGTQFSTGPDRGLYRSEDHGQTWSKVLFVSDSTGVCDVVFNPIHPETVFCATWERVRRPTYRRAFGPECGIWRSADHGATWTRLSAGLPTPSDNVGRIGLSIAASRPSTIYAQIVTGASGGYNGLGCYRSLDGGQTWARRDVSGYTNAFGGFGWYFGDLAVDPTNPDKIWAGGQRLIRSVDGGQTWTILMNEFGSGTTHPDQHAYWVDPANPNRVFVGNDGGFYWTTDNAASWNKSLDLPITQFYGGAIDASNPNRLLGGTQDNNTLMTYGSPNNWFPILGGDGFQCLVDYTDPNIVFSEYQYCSGGEGPYRSIDGGASEGTPPWPGGLAGERFNWNAPIVMDPSNHNVLLIGSQRVWKSADNGVTYNFISNDLTFATGGNLVYHTITTLDISKANTQIYYAGTDDGRVWRSLNAGGVWTEITGTLPLRYVTRVVADPSASGTVYVTLSGFGLDEHLAHVYRSTNNGNTWTSIAGNLPDVPANDLVVDPASPSTLYLATDVGVYATRDLGGIWFPLGRGMPLQSVFDLTFHPVPRTLVAATHGRSQWRLDLTPLFVGAPPAAPLGRVALSAPAPNPSRGIVRFDLDLPASGRADVSVFDAAGRRVRELASGPREAGRHTLSWDGTKSGGRRAGAGVYFVRATTASGSAVRRLVRAE